MRIISGERRGKKLETPQGMDVRPTTDRVKENLFNIIQFDISDKHFLDMFAGSGQIGLEAISRGAKCATLIDNSLNSVSVCKKNAEATGFSSRVKIVNANSLNYVKNGQEIFDVAFLDPPYADGLLEESLEIVSQKINREGAIVCEYPVGVALPEIVGDFVKEKTYVYGKISLSIYRNQDI